MDQAEPKILYIIGNGFDLWHGLQTSYEDFYSASQEYLDSLEEFFAGSPSLDSPWHDFENHLGNYEADYLYDMHDVPDISDDKFKPSMFYGFEDAVSEHANEIIVGINECFEEWVYDIDSKVAINKFKFGNNSKFLSFNYTDTLQKVYRIENSRVLHIHGSIELKEKLVFGHGVHTSLPPELDQDGESSRSMFTDAENAASSPMFAFHKPVDEIIESHSDWFRNLKKTKLICMLGHSLNNIDLPYFKKIHKVNSELVWVVSFYSDSECSHHFSQLLSIGVRKQNIYLNKIEDIPSVIEEVEKGL